MAGMTSCENDLLKTNDCLLHNVLNSNIAHCVLRHGQVFTGVCHVHDRHYAMLSQPRAFITHHAF